ncbi:MAG: MarR family winged helix-turn-helix transcriptional regulator [Halocynthiibacter sp.]
MWEQGDLIRIAEVGQCSQKRLGRLTAMDVATIKGVVDRLHKKDLVALAPDTLDKRRMLISLTDGSRAMIDTLHALGRAVSAQTLAPLSASESSTLLRLLRKLT